MRHGFGGGSGAVDVLEGEECHVSGSLFYDNYVEGSLLGGDGKYGTTVSRISRRGSSPQHWCLSNILRPSRVYFSLRCITYSEHRVWWCCDRRTSIARDIYRLSVCQQFPERSVKCMHVSRDNFVSGHAWA